MDVDGDAFIRQLAAYIRQTQMPTLHALQQLQLSSMDTRPPMDQNTDVAYATQVKFTIDPRHLQFLNHHFQDHPSSSQLDLPAAAGSSAANTIPVDKRRPSNATTASTKLERAQQRTLDLRLIQDYFQAITELKVAPIARQQIVCHDRMLPIVDLGCFEHLTHLSLIRVSPNILVGFEVLSRQLKEMTCEHVGLQCLTQLLVTPVKEDLARRKGKLRDDGSSLKHALGSCSAQSILQWEEEWTRHRAESSPSAAVNGVPLKTNQPLDVRALLSHWNMEESWQALQSLSLSQNKLKALDAATTVLLSRLSRLNLSHNAFEDVPVALAQCHLLERLYLGHNFISNLSGIFLCLGNITLLDLQYNRIRSTMGLHKLWALQHLNLAHNEISDMEEITRLGVLPELVELWISGNPVASQKKIRTKVFLGFGSKAIHLTLDGSAPSLMERMKLRLTATNAQTETIVPRTDTSTLMQIPNTSHVVFPSPAAPVPPTPSVRSRSTTTSTHRRKRTVLIESPNVISPAASSSPTPAMGRRAHVHAVQVAASPPKSPRKVVVEPSPILAESEALRKRMAHMKNEIGNGWLKTLDTADNDKAGTSKVEVMEGSAHGGTAVDESALVADVVSTIVEQKITLAASIPKSPPLRNEVAEAMESARRLEPLKQAETDLSVAESISVVAITSSTPLADAEQHPISKSESLVDIIPARPSPLMPRRKHLLMTKTSLSSSMGEINLRMKQNETQIGPLFAQVASVECFGSVPSTSLLFQRRQILIADTQLTESVARGTDVIRDLSTLFKLDRIMTGAWQLEFREKPGSSNVVHYMFAGHEYDSAPGTAIQQLLQRLSVWLEKNKADGIEERVSFRIRCLNCQRDFWTLINLDEDRGLKCARCNSPSSMLVNITHNRNDPFALGRLFHAEAELAQRADLSRELVEFSDPAFQLFLQLNVLREDERKPLFILPAIWIRELQSRRFVFGRQAPRSSDQPAIMVGTEKRIYILDRTTSSQQFAHSHFPRFQFDDGHAPAVLAFVELDAGVKIDFDFRRQGFLLHGINQRQHRRSNSDVSSNRPTKQPKLLQLLIMDSEWCSSVINSLLLLSMDMSGRFVVNQDFSEPLKLLMTNGLNLPASEVPSSKADLVRAWPLLLIGCINAEQHQHVRRAASVESLMSLFSSTPPVPTSSGSLTVALGLFQNELMLLRVHDGWRFEVLQRKPLVDLVCLTRVRHETNRDQVPATFAMLPSQTTPMVHYGIQLAFPDSLIWSVTFPTIRNVEEAVAVLSEQFKSQSDGQDLQLAIHH